MPIERLDAELRRIAQAADADSNARLAANDGAGAKRVLTAAQQELRLLKRDALDDERQLRDGFAQERLKISQSGQMLGMFVDAKARAALSRSRAARKRALQQRQQKTLQPYAEIKARIDRVQLALNQGKAAISDEIAAQKAVSHPRLLVSGGTPAPEHETTTLPPPPSGVWAQDPTGRHQYRYWDGTAWTSNVADNGVVAIDVLSG